MHRLTIVSELRAGITDEQRAEWLASDALDWANDSFAIAREPDLGYCVTVGDTCRYATDNREFEEGEPERGSWSTTAIWTRTQRSRANGSRWQESDWDYFVGDGAPGLRSLAL